jgi:hypothetical protein
VLLIFRLRFSPPGQDFFPSGAGVAATIRHGLWGISPRVAMGGEKAQAPPITFFFVTWARAFSVPVLSSLLQSLAPSLFVWGLVG